MKQPKKLSLEQKKILSRCGLQPEDWMFKFDSKNEICVIEKSSGMERLIGKNTVPEIKKALVSLATDRTFQKKR